MSAIKWDLTLEWCLVQQWWRQFASISCQERTFPQARGCSEWAASNCSHLKVNSRFEAETRPFPVSGAWARLPMKSSPSWPSLLWGPFWIAQDFLRSALPVKPLPPNPASPPPLSSISVRPPSPSRCFSSSVLPPPALSSTGHFWWVTLIRGLSTGWPDIRWDCAAASGSSYPPLCASLSPTQVASLWKPKALPTPPAHLTPSLWCLLCKLSRTSNPILASAPQRAWASTPSFRTIWLGAFTSLLCKSGLYWVSGFPRGWRVAGAPWSNIPVTAASSSLWALHPDTSR